MGPAANSTYSAPGIVMHLSLFIDLKKRLWSLGSLILNPYRNLVGMTLDKKKSTTVSD